jgi:YD repeat-containing protein
MSQKLLLQCSSGSSGQIGPFYRTQYSKYQYQEPDGTVHRFPIPNLIQGNINCDGGGTSGNASALASDNSGFRMDVTNFIVSAVYAPDGTKVYPTLQDTNGNFYTESVQTVPGIGFIDHVVDTLGREPVIASFSGNPVSQIFLDYFNPQGTRSRATVNLVPINLATQFGQGGDYSGTLLAVQSISFPDGSSYQFQYDSYGQITSMTLPTGGQVTYGYTNTTSPNQVNRWLTSRIVAGNTWAFSPVFTSCTTPCNPLTVTVTTPPYSDGTATASDNHAYSFFFASPNGGGGVWPAQIQYFRGAASGVPIVTLTKEYDNGTNNSCQHPMGNALTTVLIRETVTWPAGSATMSKKAEYCYDTYGLNLITKKMWDYQPNGNFAAAPDQEIDNVYHTDPTADAAYINANLLSLLKTSTTLGAGTQVAQSSFGYDETGFQPSGISTHHVAPAASLGNQTSVTKWLNTGGSVTSSTKWFDTGEVYQSIDPLLHTTTLTYDPAFAGAYLTKSCNALSPTQCSYAGYDFNTGLRTSSTDINGSQAGDAAYTTNYTFDTLLPALRQSPGWWPDLSLISGRKSCLADADNHVRLERSLYHHF